MTRPGPDGTLSLDYGPALLPEHARLLAESAIAPEVAKVRGYRSVTKRADLRRVGFGDAQCLVPTLLIPIWGVIGEIVLYQARPDTPRIRDGKPVKYETPARARMTLDVSPPARSWLGDPARPLFITEGIRKADSAASKGLCCIALLGVWNWRGTNEDGGKAALADWELIALNGRQVYLVFDSDVMIKPDVHGALARLKGLLEGRGAKVALIYLPPGEGGVKMGLDDVFANGHTVEDVLALASPELRGVSRDGDPEHSRLYFVRNDRICREKQTQHGMIVEPLCNFTATVTEEAMLDDGVETTRAFLIEGHLDTGETLPPVRVPGSRFSGMSWVTDAWGLRAVVRAGQTTRDYLREAIQRLSPNARRRQVFTHTGWREVNGEWIYLTANGAVGRDGFEVDLGSELTRYRLPRVPEDPVDAMRASLRLLRIAPFRVTVPLWAATYRAVLACALLSDHSLWIEGKTGSLKSTLAALFLAHYGDFDRTHLPGAWSSTANQLERRAFTLKDLLFVVDDYAPSSLDVRELEAKAARLIRSQGNLSGRGRLRSDLSERPAFPPRGLILSTGEQHPPGQSLLARTLLIEMKRADVNLEALTESQREAVRLPHAMAGYVTWLTPQMWTLPALLRETFDGVRVRVTADGEHLRVPELLAHLWLGLHCGLTYAEEIGACSPSEADDLRAQGWEALLTLGRAQGHLVEEERPSRRFLKVLLTLLTQRRATLLQKDEGGEGSKGGADLVGWQDEEALYLIPEAAFTAVTRFCRDSGEPFAVRQERLKRDLAEEGISEWDPGRHTTTTWIGGRSRRVLKLKLAAVEALLGEQFPPPSPLLTTLTGFGE